MNHRLVQAVNMRINECSESPPFTSSTIPPPVTETLHTGSPVHRPRELQQSSFSEGNSMEVQKDFKELFALLNKHRVEFVIVGGYALAFHGAPRTTGDIDVLLHGTDDNARRVIAALAEFGFANLGFRPQDFTKPGMVVQLGVSPIRVDLLTSLSGVTWAQVDGGKVPADYGGVPVHFIGREELIANKKALGRLQDLADIEALAPD